MRLSAAAAQSSLALASIALASLTVAACTPGKDEPAPPPAPAESAPVLAGVDLKQPVRALGTEPFWAVDLTGDQMVFSGPDRETVRTAQPGAVMRGTTATFDGQGLKVVLTATECSDGMSDRTYPLVAQVTVGDDKLIGCAASTSALATAGEQGPVQPVG